MSTKFFTGTSGLFIVFALFFVGGAIYVSQLQSSLAEKEAKLQNSKQRSKALADSLEKIDNYTDSTGALRELYEMADMPVSSDSIGTNRVDADVDQETNLTVNPDADTTSGRSTSVVTPVDNSKIDTVYVHSLNEDVGDYHIDGKLRVQYPGDIIDYNLKINRAPIDLTIYSGEQNGYKKTWLDAPGNVTIGSLQGSYDRQERKPDGKDKWKISVYTSLSPTAAVPHQVGSSVRRELGGFIGAGVFAELSVNSHVPGLSDKTSVTGNVKAGLTF